VELPQVPDRAGAKQVYSFATRVEPDAPEIMGKLLPLLK